MDLPCCFKCPITSPDVGSDRVCTSLIISLFVVIKLCECVVVSLEGCSVLCFVFFYREHLFSIFF